MTLFFSLLPVYLFGNFHCIGMCGPLVAMIGKHPHRHLYFLGRTLSFTLAGALAGAIGAVIDVALKKYHIPSFASFLFGTVLIALGIHSLTGWGYKGGKWMAALMKQINRPLALLMLSDRPFSIFLFGFLTVALPCGQTLLVFSACALSGDFFVGAFNGLMFALITSPSLFIAMHAHHIIKNVGSLYPLVIGISALFIGILAYLRALADLNLIPHLILHDHFVLF